MSNAQVTYDFLCKVWDKVCGNSEKIESAQVCLDELKAREPHCMFIETREKELSNCKCTNDIVVQGADLAGGWVNTTTDCQQCAEGDLCARFKIYRKETPRAYVMMGLSDTCGADNGIADLDFAFYSIIRNDVATPYWIVYIYENNTNLSWFSYDRGEVPECRDFEIIREGGEVKYYIDGNLVRKTTDTTNGAALCLDNSIHGTLTTGDICITNQSVCQINGGGEAVGETSELSVCEFARPNFFNENQFSWGYSIQNGSGTETMDPWQYAINNADYQVDVNAISNNSEFTYVETINADGTYTHTFTGTSPLGPNQSTSTFQWNGVNFGFDPSSESQVVNCG